MVDPTDTGKQAIQLKELAVGKDHITLITFDMALYEKVIQLVDSRSDLKGKVMPCPEAYHKSDTCGNNKKKTSIHASMTDSLISQETFTKS